MLLDTRAARTEECDTAVALRRGRDHVRQTVVLRLSPDSHTAKPESAPRAVFNISCFLWHVGLYGLQLDGSWRTRQAFDRQLKAREHAPRWALRCGITRDGGAAHRRGRRCATQQVRAQERPAGNAQKENSRTWS